MRSQALLEIGHLTPTLVIADRCLKSAGVRLIGLENTDAGTVCIKLSGTAAAVAEAAARGQALAAMMGTSAVVWIAPAPDAGTVGLVRAPPSYSPLIGAYDGWIPREEDMTMGQDISRDAIGLIETQGLVVVLHATDAMLKASDVSVLGKEKIGGGYVTIVVHGDLAAVQAAVDAGRHAVEALNGKLILADVISNPHPELLALLPRAA